MISLGLGVAYAWLKSTKIGQSGSELGQSGSEHVLVQPEYNLYLSKHLNQAESADKEFIYSFTQNFVEILKDTNSYGRF